MKHDSMCERQKNPINILMISATHGDELLGPKLYARLLQKRSPLLGHINFIIGNPRAYTARKRYTESDLNRSHNTRADTYEQHRANEIVVFIKQTKPDLVIDMHTTAVHQPNILIVAGTKNAAVRRLLRSSHIHTILRVQPMHDIASIADNVVGYEIPNHNITLRLLDVTETDLMRYVTDTKIDGERLVYTMTDKIYKKDVTPDHAKTFVNFEMHPLGLIPIMTGNNSYKKQTDYLGFKSDTPTRLHF